MADSIQMRVTRYTPGQDAKPTVAEYQVPLRKDSGDPRRAELCQGPRRQQPFVSLVVPDGHRAAAG